MDTIRIAVINMAELGTQDTREGVAALRSQVSEDFALVWGVTAELYVPMRHDEVQVSDWNLIIANVNQSAVITREGRPVATASIADDIREGRDWTHTASRALLGMLANPVVTSVVYHRPEGLGPRLYATEVCNPCAAYDDGYEKEGRRVSNFVLPAWFQHQRNGADARVRMDMQDSMSSPFEVRSGGWAHAFDLERQAWLVITDSEEYEVLDLTRRNGFGLEPRIARLVCGLTAGIQPLCVWNGSGPHS